jgi:hypothetical protein
MSICGVFWCWTPFALPLFYYTFFYCYQLVDSFVLQEVNRIISRFAALRIGTAATKLTAAARQGQCLRRRCCSKLSSET